MDQRRRSDSASSGSSNVSYEEIDADYNIPLHRPRVREDFDHHTRHSHPSSISRGEVPRVANVARRFQELVGHQSRAQMRLEAVSREHRAALFGRSSLARARAEQSVRAANQDLILVRDQVREFRAMYPEYAERRY